MKQKTPVDIIVGYLLFGLPLFYFFKRTFDKRIEADIKQL